MSANQFTPVIRDRILQVFQGKDNKIDLASYRQKSRREIFKDSPDTKQLRKKFESKGFHNSSLTIDGMQALSTRLVDAIEESAGKAVVRDTLNDPNFFYDFVSYIEDVRGGDLQEFGSGDYRLTNVPQDTLKDLFTEYLSTRTSIPKDTVAMIRNNVQSGHLAGVFFLKLKVALGVATTGLTSSESSYRDFSISLDGVDSGVNADKAIQTLDTILKAVLDADYITSNLVTNDQVFIDATKSVLGSDPKLFTELQFSQDNKAAGDLLQQAGLRLNKLIKGALAGETSTVSTSYVDLIKSLQPLVDVILQKADELKQPLSEKGLYDQITKNAKNLQGLINDLITTPGSPSYLDAIGLNIANILETGTTLPKIDTRAKPTPLKAQRKEVLDISQVSAEFKAAANKSKKTLKAVKNAAQKSAQVKVSKKILSLSNLQALLDDLLVDVVKRNMGDGSRRDVLNLRTGRLAESVKVEKLSQSRAGMITAFYSYMRNPYGTFSEGGRQQYPRSRDPKKLITESIRQILGAKISNRLRAVLV